ncbi:hypothetical protein Tco_1500791 [Tanacetum coccineum]
MHEPSYREAQRLAMSSDNTSSVVTYMSISSDSDGPSWGIPLMDAGRGSPMLMTLPPDAEGDPEEDDNEDPEEDPSEEHEAEDDDEDPEEDPIRA